MVRRSFLRFLMLLAAAPASASDGGSAALWRRLQSGRHVVLMRHAATVPGIGDPPGFKLDECGTQRNLSESGRNDAMDIGAAFRRHSIPIADVLSSRWCRCIDTAQLAFGRVQPAPMLDSMFNDDEPARRRKLRAARAHLAAYKESGNLVLVTHDVNIRALVGASVNQGEMVVAARRPDGTLSVIGVVPVANTQANHLAQ
jgi:broad specificity phosphatase PhoE